ncbi:hypothetical protein MXMO3_03378 [Maritalea myrionectae]|mgnify:FL=1|uniref:Organic solvent tolerance-like N-terminal domain-containing protein n=1 Tax=Maritalea myrionectae TaxID=454601 RepID=A0A2R4MIP0_9HYPH|nr:LptA/OstA family protein [Maritalea myrionectae]AVX05882.1 hypothetical protein MXMO3_03378 [Maritalea myrionectae]
MNRISTFLLFICLASFGMVGSAMTQSKGPVNITGDVFEIFEDKREAVFTGEVVVKQDDFILYSPKVIAYYGEGGASDLKKMTAAGRLTLHFGPKTAKADFGTYDPKTEILHLTGNVEVTEDGTLVTSKDLFVDVTDNSSRFTSDPNSNSRVTGVFSSGG